jgi:hypothetical protein
VGTALAKPDETPDSDTLNALLRRADQGDERAIATLRAVSDATPALWRDFGDLARQARVQLVRRIAGENAFVGEAVAQEVGRLRRAWAGDNPSPLETALAERIAACWLALSYVECGYTSRMGQADTPLTWEEDERHRKRVEQAERRYLRSIKALAEVRRIQLPTVQLNVGEQQVIVAR